MAGWSEDISELYRKLAAIAVPARTEQIATLLTLIPGLSQKTHPPFLILQNHFGLHLPGMLLLLKHKE